MNKSLRWFLIILTSMLLITSVGVASYMVNVISNEKIEIIDNTYDIIFNFYDEEADRDAIFIMENIEEDSTFDLPILNYAKKDFKGWGLSKNAVFDTSVNNSIKAIKTNFSDVSIINNQINLYAVVTNVDENTVVLEIDDQTTSNNHQTYYMKTTAGLFNIFNIRYTYPSPFVYVLFEGDTKRYTINETIDLSDKGGQIIKVLVQQ